MREENEYEKDYLVTVDRELTDEFLDQMCNGVEIYNPVRNEYTVTKKCKISKWGKRQFKITLSQGLNRQIRRMCSAFGYQVHKLKRVRVAHIHLDQLQTGKWRKLTDDEVEIFLKK